MGQPHWSSTMWLGGQKIAFTTTTIRSFVIVVLATCSQKEAWAKRSTRLKRSPVMLVSISRPKPKSGSMDPKDLNSVSHRGLRDPQGGWYTCGTWDFWCAHQTIREQIPAAQASSAPSHQPRALHGLDQPKEDALGRCSCVFPKESCRRWTQPHEWQSKSITVIRAKTFLQVPDFDRKHVFDSFEIWSIYRLSQHRRCP